MEIMCHQTARTLPPACRQELGTARPEALTFLNGRAEPPRPPHYQLPPQASRHKGLGQPRGSSATKPVMLQPQLSQALQLGVRQTLRVQWGSTQVWGQTWLVCLFFKLSDPSGSRKSLASVTGGHTPCPSQCCHCYSEQQQLMAQESKRGVVSLQMEFQGGVASGQSSPHSPGSPPAPCQQQAQLSLSWVGSPAETQGEGDAAPSTGLLLGSFSPRRN